MVACGARQQQQALRRGGAHGRASAHAPHPTPPPPPRTFCSSSVRVALKASTMWDRRSRVQPPPVTMPSSTAACAQQEEGGMSEARQRGAWHAAAHMEARSPHAGGRAVPGTKDAARCGCARKSRTGYCSGAAPAVRRPHLGRVQRILHAQLLLLELRLGLGAHLPQETHEVKGHAQLPLRLDRGHTVTVDAGGGRLGWRCVLIEG